MAELKELSEEVAEALLNQIKGVAHTHTGAALEHLCNAYAAVVTNMPRKAASPRIG